MKRILIVDDEPNVRLVFRTTLESEGFDLFEAQDGRRALDWLGSSKTDLILLDLQMPDIGGMELLRRLRAAGDDTPVVIITAHGSIPDAVQAMKLGAIDFLTKPITPQALRAVVADVLERHAEPEAEHEPEPVPSTRPTPGPTTVLLGPALMDLTAAKRALNDCDFDRAALLLEQALDLEPNSAEAQNLSGVLYESRGQDHAAYQAYKAALSADPHCQPALDNLRRYCRRFGLDFRNRAINPAAG
jgi:DNA-binding response OmpR family regulator